MSADLFLERTLEFQGKQISFEIWQSDSSDYFYIVWGPDGYLKIPLSMSSDLITAIKKANANSFDYKADEDPETAMLRTQVKEMEYWKQRALTCERESIEALNIGSRYDEMKNRIDASMRDYLSTLQRMENELKQIWILIKKKPSE